MKILLCTKTFQSITHGPAKFANLVLSINAKYPEHEIRILTEEIEEEISNQVYKISPDYPRLLHAFWPFLDNRSYYKAIKKIREEYPFDFLLFNNAIQGLRSALAKSDGVKVFGMVNDDDYLSGSIGSFNFSKKWLINFHRKPLERLACKHLDGVIVNSNYLKAYIEKMYNCPKEKVHRLYKAVNFENISFKKSRPINLEKEISILFVKSDYERGGLKLLVEALALLEYKFKVIVIGPKKAFKTTICSYFEEIINVRPDFKGPCAPEIVLDMMGDADIFCVPAHKEGLGVANIEALARGIPVVSTNIGGIPEVLDKGKNGWLSEKDEPLSLSKAIKACIDAPEERKIRSIKGRQFVEDYFNLDRMLETVIDILK